jgi:hypothetical protein
MSQSHKGSRLLLINQLIPVDFSSAHFNFNQDIYGIQYGDMIVPSGSAIYTMRPFEGKFGGAVAVEEGTTNLISSNALSGLCGYNGTDGNNSTATQTSDGWWRVPLKNNYTGNANTEILIPNSNISVSSGNTYTESFYFRTDGIPPTFNITFFTNNGHHQVTPIIYSYGNAYRAVATYTIESGGTYLRAIDFLAITGGTSTYIDILNAQVEQKGFATSFVSGNRGNGYLSYPKELINYNSFTINCWINLNTLSGSSGGIYQPVIEVCSSGHALNRLLLMYDKSSTKLTAWAADNSNEIVLGTSSGIFQANKWYMITYSFDGATYKIYINGVLNASQASNIVAVPDSSATINVGGRYWGQLNGIIDDLIIDTKAVSDEEILARFISGQPMYNPYDYRSYAF